MPVREDDLFVGRVFEDLDPRSVGRRIRVIARRRSLVGEGYRAVRINAHGREDHAHPLNLSRAQLENDYRRETTMASENKAAIDELRKAAGSIREVVRKLRARSLTTKTDAVALCKKMGFSRIEQALAVAGVLEEESDDAWLNQAEPSELVLVVARIVNGAAL